MGGGIPGGRGGPAGSSQRNLPLQGVALFTAQSAVLTKYFARSGSDVVGDLIDAQIAGTPIDDVFTKHAMMGGLQQIDNDWRAWLMQRGDVLNRR